MGPAGFVLTGSQLQRTRFDLFRDENYVDVLDGLPGCIAWMDWMDCLDGLDGLDGLPHDDASCRCIIMMHHHDASS